jgi:hypothetical protein
MAKIMITLSFICILFISPAYGEEERLNNVDVIVSPGMETIKEGDVNLVAYKGGRMRKQGDVIMPEPTEDYASRKFVDTEEHFKRIEKELEAQKKELGDLKSAVKKLEEDGRKK